MAFAILATLATACGRIGYDPIGGRDAGLDLGDGAPFDASDATQPADAGDDLSRLDAGNDTGSEDLGSELIPGVTVAPTSGLHTAESGGSATFAVVLDAPPTDTVTIAISSSDVSEATASPTSLSFTTANWNAPQLVTLIGVDDAEADGPITFTTVTAPCVSTDPRYNAYDPSDVSATNDDDETAGFTFSRTSGLITSESGGTDSFTVHLNSAPTADVVLSLASSVSSEATVSPATLTFTPLNYLAPQSATTTGVDDSVVDGDQSFTIESIATSADIEYDGISIADVSGINRDDETPAILVNPTTGLVTTEAGGTATFSVVLQSQPSAMVSIAIDSSDTTEGNVSSSNLDFTPANWNLPRVVTVTGVDDASVDGAQVYRVRIGPATSSDLNYNGLSGSDVTLTNQDDETAHVVVTPTSGLVTSEAGGTATFTVALGSQPSADITFDVTSTNTLEGTVDVATITFTPLAWNLPQAVTVTGVNDLVADGVQPYEVVLHVSSLADAEYAALSDLHVSVTNTDDESAGITVAPTSGLTTTEAGGTATFSVVLNSQPTGTVTIALSSDTPAEGAVSPATLTFTTLDWANPHVATVTGANDEVADGARLYHAVTAPAVSADTNYNGRNASDVSVTNTDDDTVGIVVSPTNVVAAEGGASASFSLVLTSQPMAGVTVPVHIGNAAQGSVAPASVTFTTSDWNIAKTISVTAVDDAIADGDFVNTVFTDAATSSDAAYNGFNASDVTVTHTDNDTAGVLVTPTIGLVTSELGGSDTFSIVLTAQPSAPVVITLSSSNTAEGTVSPASVTFTTLNWNVARVVTVTGVDDMAADGTVAYTVITAAASSSDTAYNGLAVADVAVTNTDNDIASVVVMPTSGLTTTEGGGTASFTVVLTSLPSASVSVSLASSNTLEGTVSAASLTFTTANWSTPQSVTVTGVNDAVDDGNIAYTIVTGSASSADGGYNGLTVADVSVTNTDNDTAGVTVTPTSGLVTTELLGTAMFTLVLTSQPTASVSVAISSSNTNEGTVSVASVTFTTMNWSTPQAITITGVNDFVDDGDIAYTIVTGAGASADSTYSGMVVSDVGVTNTDNDTAGTTVTPTTGLNTTEVGGTAGFTVVLNSMPLNDVTVMISSTNIAEGTVSPASLTFTNVNWSMTQTVTVTGANDHIIDGNIAYGVTTSAASSADPSYNGLAVADVSLTNQTAFAQQAYVKESNTDAGDLFGVAVALSSDGNTLVVGSKRESSAATGVGGNQADNTSAFAGAVYVYTRTGSTWTQQAYIKASNTNSADNFGISVNLSADGNTLAVGAYGEDSNAVGINGNQLDNSATNAGAAYVFTRAGAVWSQQAYIKQSNAGAGDQFARCVMLSGDGNTLAIGGEFEQSNATGIGGNQADNSLSMAGAAYVFTRSGVVWTQQAYIKESNTGAVDSFGYELALSSDGDTLVVAGTGEGSNATGIGGNQLDNSMMNAGAAYVFTRSAGVWTQQAYIKASNTEAGDFFGTGCALSADGNTMVVTSEQEDSGASGIDGNQADNSVMNSGAAFVFTRSGTVWTQQAYLKASNPGMTDNFGWRASLASDGNTVAIAAFGEASNAAGINGDETNNSMPNAGAVYVFRRTGSSWSQHLYVKASNPDSADYYGSAISLSSDGTTLVVGANAEGSNATGINGNQSSNAAMNAGASYVYTSG